METTQTTNPSLRDFFHVIFKRKKFLAAFFLVTVCVVVIATMIAKPAYEASSKVMVKVGRENLYIPTVLASGDSSPVISPKREEQINSEIEILKSGSLAAEVVESIGAEKIYPDIESGSDEKYSAVDRAAAILNKNLRVESVEISDIIQIGFKHQDPRLAAEVVNTLVQFYLDRHVEIHKNPKTYKFFGNQSEVLKKTLFQTENKLQTFKKENEISSLDEERTLLLEREAELYALLNQTRSQEAETEKRIKELRSQMADTPPTVMQEEEIEYSPAQVSDLQARLVDLELKEKQLLIKYTDQSLLVQNVREEIEVVRDKLSELESKRYGKGRTGRNPTYERLQQLIFENEAELKALHAKKATQKEQLAAYREELAKLNRVEVELKQLQQKVDVDRENYRLYMTKLEESRISDAMDAEKIANVSVVEAAKPPLEPVSPNAKMNLALAIFLGLFGGLGIAFFLEYFDDSLEKIEDVETHLQLPVLASIPQLTR